MEINVEIVQLRTHKSVSEYASHCALQIRSYSPRMLMQGLGEVLLDNASKNFVRKQLLDETAAALELFAMYPQIANNH